MKENSQHQPDRQRDPFSSREMPGEDRQPLHGKKEERDEYAEGSNETKPQTFLNQPERKTRGKPAKRCGHGANLGDRNEDGVAEAKAEDRSNGNRKDCERWCAESGMDKAERGMNSATPTVCEEQPRCSDKVTVKNLEQRNDGDGKNQSNNPNGVSSFLKGDGGGKALAGKLLPGIDIGHRADCQNIETGAN